VKLTIAIVITILSLSSFAKVELGKVDNVICGEISLSSFDEICIINITKDSGRKIAIIINMDEFYNIYDEGDLDAKVIEIDSSLLSTIRTRETLIALRDFSSEYFYLLGSINAIKIKKISNEMQLMINSMNARYNLYNLPQGYSATKLDKFVLNENAKAFLQDLTIDKKLSWKDFVLNSNEYNTRTLEEVRTIINDPWATLGVKYLLEVTQMYQVFKGQKLIGYFIQVDDHIQAAIYQDGAWIDMFVDIDQNPTKIINQSS